MEPLRKSRPRARVASSTRLLLIIAALLIAARLGPVQAAAQEETFSCADGRAISAAWVDDGYCDCEDGSDEPNTSACSLAKRDQTFLCNRSATGLPQRLFASRVGDGICDCCGGEDEAPGFCPDDCEAQAAEHVEQAQAEYAAVLKGKRLRDAALADAQAVLAEWEEEIAATEAALEGYQSVVATLKAYQAREEKAEGWERFAWLRNEARRKRKEQEEAAAAKAAEPETKAAAEEEAAVPQPPQDEEAAAGAPAAAEGEGEEEEEMGAPQEEAVAPPPSNELKITVLFDEEAGLDGVQRVLQGMVATRGDRRLALKDYLEEQEQVAQGLKPPRSEGELPSAATAIVATILEPRDVIELNLQALGALLIGPFRAVWWSFKVCLEELAARLDWDGFSFGAKKRKTTGAYNGGTFSDWQHDKARKAKGEQDLSPLARWWKQSGLEQTALGWVVGAVLKGPDTAAAFMMPHTIEGAPERMEAALLHSAVERIEGELGKMRGRVAELREQMASATYGPGHVFLAWKDKCFTKEDKEFKYEVCPFKDVRQNFVPVGKWAGWGRRRPGADTSETVILNEAEDVGTSMFFNDGQKCWSGPVRSAAVALRCGAEDLVVSVEEPSVCSYDFVMETPLLCEDALLGQARARLEALGVQPPAAAEEEGGGAAGAATRDEL